jgi:hypothetical protein
MISAAVFSRTGRPTLHRLFTMAKLFPQDVDHVDDIADSGRKGPRHGVKLLAKAGTAHKPHCPQAIIIFIKDS